MIDERRRAASAPAEEPKTARPAAADRDGLVVSARTTADRAAPATVARPAVEPRTAATPLERIREMTGADLVRTAALVVRDGGGEIRLTLRPESLGSVRIRLHLSDNAVEGRIVVDSPAVKQVFDAGLDALARALAAEGFQAGTLEVSVSGGEVADGRQAPDGPSGASVPEARGRAAEQLAAGVPALEAVVHGDLLVNVLV